MGSVVLKSLSLLLGLFFIFVGLLKISGHLSEELFRDSRKEFAKYAKVFPLSQVIGIKVPPKLYRKTVGYMEITCGISLTFLPIDFVKKISNVFLIILTALRIYSHYMINDRFERIAPALVFFFMLVGRLVIEWQVKRQALISNTEVKTQKQD